MENLASDAVYWYLNELTSRVVGESGIPSDRHHLGKIIFRSFKDAPDFIMQIDGATGEKDTFQSALERTVQCATSFRNFGLAYGDVIAVMAPNHIHLTIPIYATFFEGLTIAGMDMNLGINELKESLKISVPKIIFCQASNAETVRDALRQLNFSALVVTFDEKQGYISFTQFLQKYADDIDTENYRPADFDPKETIAILAATSGTTGVPKAASLTHQNMYIGFTAVLTIFDKFPTPIDVGIVVSPIQWVSAIFQYVMSPIVRFTRVQSSLPATRDHVYSLINKYKPELTVLSPTFLTTLLNPGERHRCDFSSFKYLLVGGSAAPKDLTNEVKAVNPNIKMRVGYGMSETSGLVVNLAGGVQGSVGSAATHVRYKLVNPTTEEIFDKPNIPGELRIKGPSVFKGYFNNPEMTKAAFDDDGWLKTGDLLYRDENFNFFFVDRLKLLLKYRNHQVSPVEIESVIVKHPGVLDAAVTGVPDKECGDLPIAFVVPQDGYRLTEQEIKNLVKESLSETKQLRGGVVFVKELPVTATSKVDRSKLKAIASGLMAV